MRLGRCSCQCAIFRLGIAVPTRRDPPGACVNNLSTFKRCDPLSPCISETDFGVLQMSVAVERLDIQKLVKSQSPREMRTPRCSARVASHWNLWEAAPGRGCMPWFVWPGPHS
jgi:hypothetical protein